MCRIVLVLNVVWTISVVTDGFPSVQAKSVCDVFGVLQAVDVDAFSSAYHLCTLYV